MTRKELAIKMFTFQSQITDLRLEIQSLKMNKNKTEKELELLKQREDELAVLRGR